MRRDLSACVLLFAVLTGVTGVIYPLVITALAQATMRERANGTLMMHDRTPVGSALIGQPFSDPKRFWSRPSTTTPQPYNGLASSGSNLGPTNPALIDAVKDRIAALRSADPDNKAPIPQDLVTASASGLDPHISVAAAQYQIARVARARGIDESKLRTLVAQHTEGRQLGVLGGTRVNVLTLNLALEALR